MTTVTGDTNAYNASYLSMLAGATLSSATSTGFVLTADTCTISVTGTGFTYSGNGPNAGTITGFSINGGTDFFVTTYWSNLSVSAAQLWSDVKSDNINDFNNLLYGGNDTFIAADNSSGAGAAFVGYGNGNETFDMTKATGDIALIGGNGNNTFIFNSNSFNSGTSKTAILGGSGYNALDFTAGGSGEIFNLSDVGNIQTINLSPSTPESPPFTGGGYVYDISLGLNTPCTIDGTSLISQDSMVITQFTTSSTPLSVEGGDGNDTVVIGGGNVTFNGDGGINTVSFAQFQSGVTVDVGLATQTINGATDTFVNVEDFIGTAHNDTFTDSTGKNVTFVATPGNDTYNAGSGFDIVDYSQLPNATVTPVQGMAFNLNTNSVTKPNGNGTDTLNGIDGVIGTGYGDTFIGNSANNYFAENTLYDGPYTNSVNYSNATGPMTFTETSDTSSARTIIATGGGEGTDTLVNINKIIGSPDGNVFLLDDAGSTFVQGSGSDTVILTEGSAYSLGSTTADASGVTTLVGTEGIGEYYSSTGNDTIFMGGGGGNLYLATTGNHFVDTGLPGLYATATIWINDQKSNYTVTQQGDRTILTGPGGVVDTFIGSGAIQFDDDEVVGISNGGAVAKALAPYDFNGDGTSDILLQNTNGQSEVWTQFGPTTIASVAFGSNPGPSWRVVGSGDFDNNGYADILWQNTDGSVAIWETNGTSISYLLTTGIVGNPGPTWKVIGAGDFNGDGKSDILWQNADGTVAIWEMNGLSVMSAAVVGANPGPTWHVIGSGDFNGDGKSDILWQNDNGSVAIWEMNGSSVLATGIIGSNPGPTWHVVGTGDFNGDGNSDILFQNTDGTVAIWEMNGLNVVSASIIGNSPGAAWHVIGTGDYNGDGFSDILFQNTDGTVAIWEMNGTTVTAVSVVGSSPGASWQVKGGNSSTSEPSGGIADAASSIAAGLAANNAAGSNNITMQASQLTAARPFAGDPRFAHILPISGGGNMLHAVSV